MCDIVKLQHEGREECLILIIIIIIIIIKITEASGVMKKKNEIKPLLLIMITRDKLLGTSILNNFTQPAAICQLNMSN